MGTRVNPAVWLPQSARVAYRCRIPGCGAEFTQADVERGAHIRHVVECSRRNEDAIARAAELHNANTMARPAWADLEYEDWIRERAAECRRRGIPFDAELEGKAFRRRESSKPAIEL